MLLEFKVTNFLSFKDENIFSLMKGIGSELPENLHDSSEISLPSDMKRNFGILKSAFLYGWNWAGKSNLLKAVSLLRNLVVNSGRATPNMIVYSEDMWAPFVLDEKTAKQPIEFEVLFEIGGVLYRYYTSFNQERILKENLHKYAKGEVRITQKLLFSRVEQDIIIHDFDDNDSKDRVLHNSLALSKFASENSEEAGLIHKFFSDLHVLTTISDVDYILMFDRYQDEFKDFVVKIFENAKFGISDIGYSVKSEEASEQVKMFLKMNNQPIDPAMKSLTAKITASHHVYGDNHKVVGSANIPLLMESNGIIKILKLAGSLFNVIKNGKILFFDELDIALHSSITRKLVQSLHAVQFEKKSQFVFATHDPSLLDIKLLRRDQIWFIKRDKYGASTMKSLVELDTVKRKDISIEKLYRSNAFDVIDDIRDALIPDVE